MRTSLLSIAALLVVACGSKPPEPTKTAADDQKEKAADAAPKGALQVAAPTTYDLSPVPEPQDVVGAFHFKNPTAAARTFAGCAAIPPDRAQEALEFEARKVVRNLVPSGVDPRALTAVIAFDAPVFAVAALDTQSKRPNAFVGISVGLTSLEKARAAVDAAGPLTELAPGMYRIAGRAGATCVIAASAGSTPARLVCGPKEKDVTTLGPYLTRTLPTAAQVANDVHMELRVAPIEARFGSMLRTQIEALPMIARAEGSIGDPTFDKAIVDAAGGVADEAIALLGDADKIMIDGALDPATCLKASASLSVRGKSSFLAGLMTDRPERAGPPPAIFWRAPKDAGSVFYGRGTDPKRFQPIFRTVKLLVEGGLNKFGIGSDADHRALTELFDLPIGTDVATVTATGRSDTSALTDKKASPQQQADALVNGMVSWYVVGYEDGSDKLAKYLRKIADVYNRKGYQDVIAKMLPKEAVALIPKVKVGAGPAGLGAGALDLSVKVEKVPAGLLKVKGANPKDVVNIEAHLLLMQDGKSRTWLGFAMGKPDALVKRMLAAKTGAPDEGTIASRADLEPLRRGNTMSGGFASLGPLFQMMTSSKAFADLQREPGFERVIRSIATLPNQGAAPIFLTTTVSGAETPRGEVAVSASKQVLEDIGWLLKTLGPQ